MASALLSRFDLIFILMDRADEEHDKRISEHIMGMSTRGLEQPSVGQVAGLRGGFDLSMTGEIEMLTLSQRLRNQCKQFDERPMGHRNLPISESRHLETSVMRKYIEHARGNVFPRLSPPAAKVLQKMYLTMRSNGAASGAPSGMPVTTRHLESLIRLSQARARMELRDVVCENK